MKININVLNQVEEKRTLLSIIRKRSGKMCGCLLSYNPFLTNIFEGQINGHKGRRSRKAYLEELTRKAGCNRYVDMKRLTII